MEELILVGLLVGSNMIDTFRNLRLLLTWLLIIQVGTSLGATKGLLLRGGSILEKFSSVNTIVFDKTGTLTIGKPVVTKVVTQAFEEDADMQLSLDFINLPAIIVIQIVTNKEWENNPVPL